MFRQRVKNARDDRINLQSIYKLIDDIINETFLPNKEVVDGIKFDSDDLRKNLQE